jgi:hypothetical protein
MDIVAEDINIVIIRKILSLTNNKTPQQQGNIIIVNNVFFTHQLRILLTIIYKQLNTRTITLKQAKIKSSKEKNI